MLSDQEKLVRLSVALMRMTRAVTPGPVPARVRTHQYPSPLMNTSALARMSSLIWPLMCGLPVKLPETPLRKHVSLSARPSLRSLPLLPGVPHVAPPRYGQRGGGGV